MLFKVNFSFHRNGVYGKAYVRVKAEDKRTAEVLARGKFSNMFRVQTTLTDVRVFQSRRADHEAD